MEKRKAGNVKTTPEIDETVRVKREFGFRQLPWGSASFRLVAQAVVSRIRVFLVAQAVVPPGV